jgi:hypothetical protein
VERLWKAIKDGTAQRITQQQAAEPVAAAEEAVEELDEESKEEQEEVRLGTWARVTIDHFRHSLLQIF